MSAVKKKITTQNEKKDFLKNCRGFSLVQVLIAAALLIVMSTLFAEMTNNGLKSQKTIQTMFDFNNLTSLVAMTLQNQQVCKSNMITPNLQTLTFDTTQLANTSINITTLNYPDGSVLILKII